MTYSLIEFYVQCFFLLKVTDYMLSYALEIHNYHTNGRGMIQAQVIIATFYLLATSGTISH